MSRHISCCHTKMTFKVVFFLNIVIVCVKCARKETTCKGRKEYILIEDDGSPDVTSEN